MTSSKPVMGIFQASVLKALELLGSNERYGIVSTGSYWRDSLTKGVASMQVQEAISRLASVETTGIRLQEA